MELDPERAWDRNWSPREPTIPPGIEIDGRGRAMIAGTAVEAHRIAALLDGGMDVDEVVSDYNSIDRAQVLAAKAYSDAHPWRGESYPRLTAKKAMREAKLDGFEKYLPRRRRSFCSMPTSSANSPRQHRPSTSCVGSPQSKTKI